MALALKLEISSDHKFEAGDAIILLINALVQLLRSIMLYQYHAPLLVGFLCLINNALAHPHHTTTTATTKTTATTTIDTATSTGPCQPQL